MNQIKKSLSSKEERPQKKNFVTLEGPTMTTTSMTDAVKETQSVNKPMKDWSRVIIETDEKNPKILAVVTADDYQLANGLAIRIKPVYND